MRLFPALSALLATSLITGCTGGPAIEGMFNNDPDYEAAYSAHAQHWEDVVGTSADSATVQHAFRSRGGGCTMRRGSGLLDCAVDVLPEYPSLFTRRIMWSMTFASDHDNRVRLRETNLHHLGLDL